MDKHIEDIRDLRDLIDEVVDAKGGKYYPIDVVAEDDNGEVRYVEFAWYDEQRKMLRLTLRNVLFTDNEED